jgi:predicted DNA-binding transcriptional regulator AlpA
MSNERLRARLQAVGLTPARLADKVAVDRKTVDRWIANGRLPHPVHYRARRALVWRLHLFWFRLGPVQLPRPRPRRELRERHVLRLAHHRRHRCCSRRP